MNKMFIKFILMIETLISLAKCANFYYPEDKSLPNDFLQKSGQVLCSVVVPTSTHLIDNRNGIIYSNNPYLVTFFIFNVFSVQFQQECLLFLLQLNQRYMSKIYLH